MTPGLRRLYMPRPAKVEVGRGDEPVAVDGVAVESVREEWLVEDGWWTLKLLRRHYFELVLVDGRDVVVFRDAVGDRWYRQRG
jgi:hypothetical protein